MRPRLSASLPRCNRQCQRVIPARSAARSDNHSNANPYEQSAEHRGQQRPAAKVRQHITKPLIQVIKSGKCRTPRKRPTQKSGSQHPQSQQIAGDIQHGRRHPRRKM